MKHLSMQRFATLWSCECDWKKASKYTITIYEPLEIDAPPDARPYCSSWDIEFYDKSGNKSLGKARCHNREGAAPDMMLIGGKWYEVTGGEVRFVEGRWHVVRTGYLNGRLPKMMNAGWPEFKKG